MITNQEQYKLTQVHANNFARELEKFNEYCMSQKDLHPLHEKAVRDSLTSQLGDLLRELEEYESLTSASSSINEIESINELPIGLIKARIIAGISQQELADKLGIDRTKFVRLEVDGYSEVEHNRLIEIADILNVHLSEEIRAFGRIRYAEESAK